jgi:hypothetical protein
MAGIILHGAQFGRDPQRIGDPFGRPLVVGRERNTDMTIVEDGIVLAVSLLDLIERLGDQKALEAVARHEGQSGFEEIKPAERGEFVEHQQQSPALGLRLQIFRETPADLVEYETNERLGPRNIRWRHDQIQCRRRRPVDEVADTPVASRRHLCNHGIAIEAEERHGGRQHARAFVLALVEEFTGRGGDHGMRTISEMQGRHHGTERRFDGSLRIRQEIGEPGERLVGLRVQNMENGANQQSVTGLFPMIAPFKRAFGIDQDIGDVLDIAHFTVAAAHLDQRVVSRRCRIGRIEQQHAAETGTPAGGQLPVFTFDVMNDATARPCQQRRNDETDPLPAAGRRETKYMLRSVVSRSCSFHLKSSSTDRTEDLTIADLSLAAA